MTPDLGGTAGTTRLLYDGDELIAEYDYNNAMLRRYVHSGGADDPLVWYEGAGVASPRYLYADHQGSIVAVADSTGAPLAIDSYDDWGIPGAGNQGRFQYTGQAWLPELGMYYYKARIYSPTLGRFLQTDPIGYDDQINLYAYVGNDPVDGRDPTGLARCITPEGKPCSFDDPLDCAGKKVNSACTGDTLLGNSSPNAAKPHKQPIPKNGEKVVAGADAALGAFHDAIAELSHSSRFAKFFIQANGKILVPLGVYLKYKALNEQGFSPRASAAGAFAALEVQINAAGVGSGVGLVVGTIIEPGGGTAAGGYLGALAGGGADWYFGWSDQAAEANAALWDKGHPR